MNLLLVDNQQVRGNLLPLTFTRPSSMLPAGINHTIADRWRFLIPDAVLGFDTESYLSQLFPPVSTSLKVYGHIIPTAQFAAQIKDLTNDGEWIADQTGQCIAWRGQSPQGQAKSIAEVGKYTSLPDIFTLSKQLITSDFHLLTKGRKSSPLSPTCTLIGPSDLLFIEEGAYVEAVTISTHMGPVYIGHNADVQEGCVLRGPVAIGPDCRVRAGARLLPGVNMLQSTRVGGEISNTVFLGYSNKQHDGFLGDAVIGQWCNIGAGTVASNLKNNYSEIKLWNYPAQRFLKTGRQFCGLIMADHCKAAINTSFNTATVVGPGCNVHGAGFPRPYLKAFTEGGVQMMERTPFKAFITTAREMMRHRAISMSQADENLLKYLYDHA